MINNILERLCVACDHRFPALCAYIARQDAMWKVSSGVCDRHRKLRKSFLSGMIDLPFKPTPAMLEQQVIARSRQAEGKREAIF